MEADSVSSAAVRCSAVTVCVDEAGFDEAEDGAAVVPPEVSEDTVTELDSVNEGTGVF